MPVITDHALFLILALLLNAAIAGPRSWYQLAGVERITRLPSDFLRSLERKLNREHRSEREREIRGMILVAVVAIVALILGWICALLFAQKLSLFELLLVTACLPVREGIDIAMGVRKHVQGGDIARARAQLSGTVWKHHAMLDEAGLCRATVELLAVQFSLKIAAPVFWYLLLGLPGLFMSKLIYLLHEITGRSALRGAFAKSVEGFHQLIHIVPAHMVSILWLIAAPFVPVRRWNDVLNSISERFGYDSEVLTIASAAAAQNLTLGGPGSIYTQGQWQGSGPARAGTDDVKRALYFFGLLCVLLLILLGILF